jgi:hypothetical protein
MHHNVGYQPPINPTEEEEEGGRRRRRRAVGSVDKYYSLTFHVNGERM